jgi:D-3-phosphoglycerate dehydrogenase / 2-oxoglutarate reductase
MAAYRVVVSDQVFPSVDQERELLAGIGATLDVLDATVEGLRARGADADAVLTTYLQIDADSIGTLSRCRIIARYGIGVDNVDLAAAAKAGITVTNVPDYSVQEVAAHALALILALLRKVPQSDAKIRSGGWGLDGLRPMRRISTLTVGLIGYGRIARRLQRSIEALDATVVAYDPFVKPGPGLPPLLSLDDLLERSDVVSVHAPLTPETRGLVNAAAVARMKAGALLVNTSRGPLVDLDAVIEGLRSGHLAGAGLDVFDREPLDPARIEGAPNLIVTPHTGYYSEESITESQRKAATQVIKVLTGQAPDYPVRA